MTDYYELTVDARDSQGNAPVKVYGPLYVVAAALKALSEFEYRLQGLVTLKVERAVASRLLSAGKRSKYLRKRDEFFDDSKSAFVRSYGRLTHGLEQ